MHANFIVAGVYYIIQDDAQPLPQAIALVDKLLNQAAAEGNVGLARSATLYALRQLTDSGLVDVANAIQTIRSARFPREIRAHPILQEVAVAIQNPSPLAALPQFAEVVAMMCNVAQVAVGEQPRGQLAALVGRFLCFYSD